MTTRTCSVCHGPMTITEPGQTLHPTCDPNVQHLLGRPAREWIPPLQRGPCATCGTPIRRYGEGATTLCANCKNRRTT